MTSFLSLITTNLLGLTLVFNVVNLKDIITKCSIKCLFLTHYDIIIVENYYESYNMTDHSQKLNVFRW